MSLILEALRKSEAERRRGLAPDVAMELPPTPASRPRALATWLPPVLVVAALLVLAGWWTRRTPAETASTDTVNDTAHPMPEATPRAPPVVPRIQSKPAVVPSVQAPDMAATGASTPTRATAPTIAAPAAERPTPFRPAPVPIQPAPPPARPLPTPTGDISNDTSMLPPVKLSMLMWDEVPSKRFVILNGQRMAEGDRYGGIALIAIERNGVVVEGNGTRARVPLP